MAVVSFPARNPLAYPAGRKPGFDPSHPAAQNCAFSGVTSLGGQLVEVRTGVMVGSLGTPTTSIYGPLGVIANYVGDTDNAQFPFVSPASVSVTLAGIVKITGPSESTASYILNTHASGATAIGWDIGATGNFSFFVGSGAISDTGVPVVLERPYFYAASFNGAVVNWVIRRLDSGQLFTGPTTNADAILVGDGVIYVGNRGTNNRELNGGVAAAMASTAFMSQQQLNAWSLDPWAFWYPPQVRSLVAATAVAPTTVLYSLMNVG